MSRYIETTACLNCAEGEADLTCMTGKPVEFRSYAGISTPIIGVRWDCPVCGTAHFLSFHRQDLYWSPDSLLNGDWNRETVRYGDITFQNDQKGRFARVLPGGRVVSTGYFRLGLSWYESFNDERGDPDKIDNPAHLVASDDDCSEHQWK